MYWWETCIYSEYLFTSSSLVNSNKIFTCTLVHFAQYVSLTNAKKDYKDQTTLSLIISLEMLTNSTWSNNLTMFSYPPSYIALCLSYLLTLSLKAPRDLSHITYNHLAAFTTTSLLFLYKLRRQNIRKMHTLLVYCETSIFVFFQT